MIKMYDMDNMNTIVWNAPVPPIFTPWPARKNALPNLRKPHDCSFRPLLTAGEILAEKWTGGMEPLTPSGINMMPEYGMQCAAKWYF